MKKRVTVTTMMMAVLLSWPTEALCQTTVTAGKNVQAIGVKAAAEGVQEAVAEIDEEGQEVPAAEGSTVRVTGNAPEEGQAARLKLTLSKAPGSEEVKVQSIEVTGTGIIDGGAWKEYRVNIKPENADNQNVTWSVADCDKDGKLLGTQDNVIATRNATACTLTGIKKGYVMVTAEAQDGSGVKGSLIVEVKSDCPPQELETGTTSAIGGSSASFAPTVAPGQFIAANPNSADMDLITGMTAGFILGMIMEMAPNIKNKLGDYNTIICKKALRLVNCPPGMGISCDVKINCNLGVPGEQVVFLMLYMDTNSVAGDAVNAELASNDTIHVTLPAEITTAIKDKFFVGLILKR